MTFDEFLDLAAEDPSWLNFARMQLILNEFRLVNGPAPFVERKQEKAQAQSLVMTERERKAFTNAMAARLGSAVGLRKRKLNAGEMDKDAADRERAMFALGRRRYDEDLRKREAQGKSIMPMLYYTPKSDEELYASYYSTLRSTFAADMVAAEKQYGFAIFYATELRDGHEEAVEAFKTNYNKDNNPPTGFFTRLAALESGSDDPEATNPAALTVPYDIIRNKPISFEFYWTEYLNFMLGQTDTYGGKVFWFIPPTDEPLGRLVEYQAVSDFEASQADHGAFRDHFCQLRASGLKDGIHRRYFLVCTPDGTPSLAKAFTKDKCQVWVYGADWKPLDGVKEGMGYQGMIKVGLESHKSDCG